MSQNRQLQKTRQPHIRRIRHRLRLGVNPKTTSRQPSLTNFLTASRIRLNTIGGVAGVDEDEVFAAIVGVGTSDKNRNNADTFDIQVDAQLIRRMTVVGEVNNAGIPII